ncbi:hypothetical protein ACHAWF_006801 [Thalassiosira exigua]
MNGLLVLRRSCNRLVAIDRYATKRSFFRSAITSKKYAAEYIGGRVSNSKSVKIGARKRPKKHVRTSKARHVAHERIRAAKEHGRKHIRMAKKHAPPSILSATLLTLTDGSTGGGWGAALSFFRNASGMKYEETTYSLSLGLLPLCLLYTGYGLFDDDDVTPTPGLQPTPRVEWPGAMAFATSLLAGRIVPGVVFGSPGDVNLLPPHPIVRTASNGLFSFFMIGLGCVSLQRSHASYKLYNEVGGIAMQHEISPIAIGSKNYEKKENELSEKGRQMKNMHQALVKLRRQALMQFQLVLEDWPHRAERIVSYMLTGGATGLGLFLLGPSAMSVPVPLLVYLANNENGKMALCEDGLDPHADVSPRQAFDSLVAGICPYLLFNIGRSHYYGAQPRVLFFVSFASGVGVMYWIAEKCILPHTPEYVAHGTLGVLSLCGGMLRLVSSVRGVTKILQ